MKSKRQGRYDNAAGAECKYELPEEGLVCPHKVYRVRDHGEFCVFHLPKPLIGEIKELSAERVEECRRIADSFHVEFWNYVSRAETDPRIPFLDFRGFQFPEFIVGAELEKHSNFSHAKFCQSISFGHVPATTYTFEFDMDFSESTFFDDVDFAFKQFEGKANFSGVTFKKESSFAKTGFLEEADFARTTFSGKADFHQAQFHQKTDFEDSTFQRSGNFNSASFNDEVRFLDATFDQVTHFMRTSFQALTFWGTQFKAGVVFDEARFLDKPDFTQVDFKVWVTFRRSTFKKGASFSWSNFPERTVFVDCAFEGEFEFVELTLGKDADFSFTRVDLSQATFLETDLTAIKFREVQWSSFQRRRFGIKRNEPALWDMTRSIRDRPEFEKIAENCSQLVLNYEAKRDYELAEYFHIGEMEMRRLRQGGAKRSKTARRLLEHFNLYTLYNFSSRYGTSYWQALIVLAVMINVFSASFMLSGFQPNRDTAGVELTRIEYNFLPDETHHLVPVQKLISDYLKSVLFTLSIITFQRERFYEPVGWAAQLFLYLAVIFLTSQSAMVLLAIRRRFKR